MKKVNKITKLAKSTPKNFNLLFKTPQRNFRSISGKFPKNLYLKPFLGLDRLKF